MPVQQQFLEKVAEFILQKDEKELLKTLIVFPNQRSAIFLKNHLQNKAQKDLWLPEMLTIDELMTRFSGLTILDSLSVSLKLYEIHKKIEGDKARSLDDFLNWAPIMLNDFNEIDYYLVPAENLFSELSEVKAMEKWNLDGKPLTDLQAHYLKFFHSLFKYYEELNQLLLADKTAYKGMAYRWVAEDISKQELVAPWHSFIFVGFNALTEAEKVVVKFIKENHELDYLIDADHFYFDTEGIPNHEAGMFLRDALKTLNTKHISWIGNDLLQSEKVIEIAQSTKQMGQVKFAGNVLKNWFSARSYDPGKTALVLMDESLLVPMLANVPLNTGGENSTSLHYNVTMGYPLVNSPFYDFTNIWLQMLLIREEDKPKRISLPTLISLLQNPLSHLLLGTEVEKSLNLLKSKNQYYESERVLLEENNTESVHKFLQLLFEHLNTPTDFFAHFTSFLQLMASLPDMADPSYVLLRFQLLEVTKIVKTLGVMLGNRVADIDFGTLQKLFSQLISRQEISLKGEPLSGVQVMGLLETRNLDFENIIFLGANEGQLPKTGFQDSFIPFDLRIHAHLPLPNSKTSVVSYHFFRLLQRAKHVVMLYNSEAESLGSGEASRYILQIENELIPRNRNIKLDKIVVNVPLKDTINKTIIRIDKDASVLEQLDEKAQKGFSPSALNSYINCPLQFYYKEVLHPKLPERMETSIESDTFGSVVHGVLEEIYAPFLDKSIDANAITKRLSVVEVLLKGQFIKYYGPHDLSYGKNLLMFHVAREYVTRFVKNDAYRLKKQGLILLGLELRLQSTLNIGGKTVNIKGFIDRVDSNVGGGKVRIVDYKTGSVNPADLKVKDWDALMTDQKYSKALQVLTYQWLYNKKNDQIEDVSSGLISLKTKSGNYLSVEVPEITGTENFISFFEKLLVQLLNEIYDENTDFVQTDNPEHCKFCDFKTLCNR